MQNKNVIIVLLANFLMFGVIAIYGLSGIEEKQQDPPKVIVSNDISEQYINEYPGRQTYFYHWPDDFSNDQKEKLTYWLDSVANTTQRILGRYPFDMVFILYKNEENSNDGPSPMAHTERGDTQGVNFYVNPTLNRVEYFQDWTAPHEISHLAIPFLGNEYSWFSEGFATYMQTQILLKLGVLNESEMKHLYATKVKSVKKYFNVNSSMKDKVKDHAENKNYHGLYRGGLCYFLEVEKRLSKQGMKLTDIIKAYQKCCRLRDKNFKEMILSLDLISGESIFTDVLKDFSERPARDFIAQL